MKKGGEMEAAWNWPYATMPLRASVHGGQQHEHAMTRLMLLLLSLLLLLLLPR